MGSMMRLEAVAECTERVWWEESSGCGVFDD